jgi:hypothetical protein
MARVLVKKNVAKAIRLLANDPDEKETDKLPEGHMRYVFFNLIFPLAEFH